MIKSKIGHLILGCFLLLILCLTISGFSSTNEEEKPNILWLVTEDNSKHFLNLYDKDGAHMPHLESLAKKSILFNHAFSNAPVCSVARSTIISGCNAPRVGAQYHRRMELVPMPDGLEMFPYYLKKNGYYTTNNAKEDYNFIKGAEVWDDSSRKASYRNRKSNQAFFHVQNFGMTHEGALHFSEEEMLTTKNNVESEDVTPFSYHPDNATFRYTYARYLDLHQKADNEIGQFLSQLEEDGEMENTIIFYYGDHGGVLPRSKGYIYESGVHVPMLVYFPEKWKHLAPVEMGTRSDAFVQFIDLAPTVLNLADIEIPDQIDGKPFLGKGVTVDNWQMRNTAFCYADRFDEKYDMVRSLRKGKYKYIRNYQPFNIDALFNFYRYKMLAYKNWEEEFKNGNLDDAQKQFFQSRSPETLYNINDDPHEIHNLANDPALRTTLLELRKELKEQVKGMPDLSFFPESYFLEKAIGNPVQFGQLNKEEISELIDIADLSLLPFLKAKKSIQKALINDNPWKRYWGLIVCSSFGIEAETFFDKAREIAESDEENLVRMRAFEFLALNKQTINIDHLLHVIQNAKTNTEANLILNSVALIKSVDQNFKITIPRTFFAEDWVRKENDLLSRRIEFINN